jgi:hypothetical protein
MNFRSDPVGSNGRTSIGELFLVSRSTGARPVKLASGLMAPADLVVDRKRGWLIVPENAGNRLSIYELTKFDSSDT